MAFFLSKIGILQKDNVKTGNSLWLKMIISHIVSKSSMQINKKKAFDLTISA